MVSMEHARRESRVFRFGLEWLTQMLQVRNSLAVEQCRWTRHDVARDASKVAFRYWRRLHLHPPAFPSFVQCRGTREFLVCECPSRQIQSAVAQAEGSSYRGTHEHVDLSRQKPRPVGTTDKTRGCMLIHGE